MDIELFDKRYVYLEWSDELEGKDCILAKTYQNLKDFVNSGDEDRIFKVNKGTEKPFTNHCVECDFCYYDPNLKVKKAWLEGKTIQRLVLNKWKDYIDTPRTSVFFYNTEWDAYGWRIKPIKENTYRKNFIRNNEKCAECNGFYCHECKELKKFINNIKFTRRMTNRELARWLAEGNGEMKINYFLFNAIKPTVYASHSYLQGTENKEVESSIRIRDFGSDEWREPLIEV